MKLVNKEFIGQEDNYNKILDERFYFVNPDQINHFLISNPEIVPLLIESFKEITDRFYGVKPTLELIKDIELPEWETLKVSFYSRFDYENSFDKINDLYKKWMFHTSKRFKKLTTISFY